MRVSLIQMNSGADKAHNLDEAERLIRKVVAEERPGLVALPECFAHLGGGRAATQASGEDLAGGPTARRFSALATELGVTLHLGSQIERDGDRHYNTTVVFGPSGERLARYRKLHLFDVEVPGGQSYRESEKIDRGSEVVTYALDGVTVGCAICYDLRFPELFRALRDRGAQVIVLPSAFTLMTGKDHWEVLLRARAIETQCYVLAPAQWGAHDGGTRHCWGHSLVADPWGAVIARASDGVGTTSAVLDLDRLAHIRRTLPVAQHHIL